MSDYQSDGAIQTSALGADGALHDQMVVYWHTPDGAISGQVRVPLQAGWAQAAADAIQAQIAELRQAGAL